MQCLPSPLSLPLAKRLGFPRDLRLWQSHLFLMFLVPLSWKHGGHSVEGWWINLIKMTGPDRDHCPSCTWWNHQDVNSIINTWWTSEFPVIQVKMVLSSGVFCLITDITCVGTAQFTRFQIHSYCQLSVAQVAMRIAEFTLFLASATMDLNECSSYIHHST